MSKSLLDIAYQIILKRHEGKETGDETAISFTNLWKEICKESENTVEQSNELVGYFYTNLILDNRFVSRGDNTWDLRQYYTLEEVSKNTDFYHEAGLDEGTDDEEEVEVKDQLDINEIDGPLTADEEANKEEVRIEDIQDYNL